MPESLPQPLKRCTKCKEEKPATAEFFYRQKRGKFGFQSRCKSCSALYGQTDEAREKERLRQRERRLIPEVKQREKEYKQTPKYKAWNREYQSRSEVKEAKKKSRQKPEQKAKRLNSERKRLQRPEVRERKRERERANYQSPEYRYKHRLKESRRRARLRSLPDNFTAIDEQRMMDYWDYKCCVCSRPPGLWHIIAVDHWIPLTDPRPDNPGTVPWNMLPMCHSEIGRAHV